MSETPELSDDFSNIPSVIKVPSTPIMNNDGYIAREWVYFFNDIGNAVDEQIKANLPELVRQLLENVSKVLELGDDAEEMQANIIRIDAKTLTNAQDITNANSRISTNSSGIAAAGNTIANHTTALSGLAGRLNDKDLEVTDIQAQLASITNSLSTQEGALVDIDTQLQEQDDALLDFETRIAALEARP